MKELSSDWYQHLEKDFVQGFPAFCGFEVTHVEDGIFHTQLQVRNEHQQQDAGNSKHADHDLANEITENDSQISLSGCCQAEDGRFKKLPRILCNLAGE